MKRMMMMMVVVALAMATNAATVSWQITGLKAPIGGVANNPTFSANNLSGAIGYLFVGAQDTAAITAAIQGGTFTGAGNLWSQTTSATGAILKSSLGSYSNQDVTLYSVIFNAATIAASTFYMISSDYTQHFTTANLQYVFTTANGRLPTQWSVVPEPTSMALLALGAAALGLRRKNRK